MIYDLKLRLHYIAVWFDELIGKMFDRDNKNDTIKHDDYEDMHQYS
jgi:hypothetical protein